MVDERPEGAIQEELPPETPAEFGPAVLLLRRPFWADLLVFLLLAAVFYLIVWVAQSIAGPRRIGIQIDLAPGALPKYMVFSVFRGFAAYALSLTFSLVYGYVAAKHRRAERVMIPILDVFQSVPVLGFLPGLMLGLGALFSSNLGLELGCIVLIFTGQVWNMTFSFYHSLRSIPEELHETARAYGFSWWQRFTRVELPFAALPLAWNSMIGMAGGWFFLTICESFRVGHYDFRLPGVGSYMTTAIVHHDFRAMGYGIAAMTLMIVLIDRLVWRPVIAWAQKFKFEETAPEQLPGSWMLDLLRASRVGALLSWSGRVLDLLTVRPCTAPRRGQAHVAAKRHVRRLLAEVGKLLAGMLILVALALVALGAYLLLGLVRTVEMSDWLHIGFGALLSFLRVMGALVLATAWTVPVGIWIGTNPRLVERLQGVIQIVASFPYPMLFPLLLIGFQQVGFSLEIGSILLLMLGTQWYILFNAIAGAMSIPEELRETCRIYRIRGLRLWRRLYLPAVLTSLVTGWIAAAGGAWNASIVAEYVRIGDHTFTATGLGAIITKSTEQGRLSVLAAAVMVMAMLVVLINRFLWKRIFAVASERFTLSH